jgi:hypothetical protein
VPSALHICGNSGSKWPRACRGGDRVGKAVPGRESGIPRKNKAGCRDRSAGVQLPGVFQLPLPAIQFSAVATVASNSTKIEVSTVPMLIVKKRWRSGDMVWVLVRGDVYRNRGCQPMKSPATTSDLMAWHGWSTGAGCPRCHMSVESSSKATSNALNSVAEPSPADSF